MVNAGGAGMLGGGAWAVLADGSGEAGGMIRGRQWAAAESTPIQRDNMKMRIESHVARAALDNGQQSALCRRVLGCQSLSIPAQQRILEHARHQCHQAGLIRQRRSQGKRYREHPLAERLRRQNMREQVERGLVHPATEAGGTETTASAREGHQTGQAAILASKVREASFQHAAVEVARELRSHERGQPTLPSLLDGRVEGRQVFAHHPMQRRESRVVSLVHPWYPPPCGVDLGQGPVTMRAARHPCLSASTPPRLLVAPFLPPTKPKCLPCRYCRS